MKQQKTQKSKFPLIVTLVVLLLAGLAIYYQFSKPPTVSEAPAEETEDVEISTYPPSTSIVEYKSSVIDVINEERKKLNLQPLVANENVCTVAGLLAEESERVYPQEVGPLLKTDAKYKDHLTDYSNFYKLKITPLDMLVEYARQQNQPLTLSDGQLVSLFSKPGPDGLSALEPTITHGCVAVSSGTVGYKPFAYFVGASR